MKVLVLGIVVLPLSALAAASGRGLSAEPCSLRVVADGGTYRVETESEGQALLSSPPEGLWSIAMDWGDDWPSGWVHCGPSEVERVGGWTILRGEIVTPEGSWRLSDSYRQQGRVVKCVRRYVWEGEGVAEPCTLSVRFQAPGSGPDVVMPGILYHGNPSGARSGRVPVYGGKPGEEAIYEEHRFPMPFVSLEWPRGDGLLGAAMHSLPSPAPYANLRDQWWSMGVIGREQGTEFVLLSGPCASNGQRSVIKAVQPGFVPYKDAYLRVPPGAIIEKTFYLEAYPVAEEGSGFRRPVETSLEMYGPFSSEGLPTFGDIVEAKYGFGRTRWHDVGAGVAGFHKYPDRHFFVIGWCGQAAAQGYALQVLHDDFGEAADLAMVQKSLDFLSGAEFYEGGFHTWYSCDKKEWSHHEPLSQGQGMLNVANAIRVAKGTELDTSRWEDFLRKASRFHSMRILADDWNPESTDEAFFIAPLCQAYSILGEDVLRDAAVKAGEVYASRHVAMREPYWGGTLDASCEDKEGAFAALQGFLALYELTGEDRFLRWAEHACDVALTYVVLWDIDLPPGRLRDHGFKTRGWTVVSPQNQHIDVYGVFIAPDVYRLGRLLERDDLKQLAILMYRSCGQLLDPYGSQGEQPQHTNYAQRGEVDDVFALRGGYVEDWTVFWITAHFLNAAAQFEEMGVAIRE